MPVNRISEIVETKRQLLGWLLSFSRVLTSIVIFSCEQCYSVTSYIFSLYYQMFEIITYFSIILQSYVHLNTWIYPALLFLTYMYTCPLPRFLLLGSGFDEQTRLPAGIIRIVQFLGLFLIPKSPRWLVTKCSSLNLMLFWAYTSLANNCLMNESNQRSLEDCSSFYAERGLNFVNFGAPERSPTSHTRINPEEEQKVDIQSYVSLRLFLSFILSGF